MSRMHFNAVELISMPSKSFEYLLDDLLPNVGAALLAGKPDIGKSQLARQLCIHVALGMPDFLGIKLTVKHQSSIYISTEDGAPATRNQLSNQLKGLGKAPVESLRFLFGETLDPAEIVAQLEEALKAKPADLVVIDSFGDIFNGGDSNSNVGMRNSVKPFAKLASTYGCLVLFIHHVNKGAYNQAPGQEHIQGGSGLVQKIRTALSLTDGDGSTRYLSTVKGNYTSKKLKKNSLVLEFNEDTLLFTNTGALKPTSDLGVKSEARKEEKFEELEAIAQTVFGKRELTYGEFVKEYCDGYGIGTATAKRHHRDLKKLGLISQDGDRYHLTKPLGPPPAIKDSEKELPIREESGMVVTPTANQELTNISESGESGHPVVSSVSFPQVADTK